LGGGDIGQSYWFDETGVVIGRSREASLAFQDDTISRKHAQIVFDGTRYLLRDLGSRNGTYCNGGKITEHVLSDGDKVLVGANLLFRFNLADPADARFQEQLRNGVSRDLLTGVFNERHVRNNLTAELAFSRRHGSPLSLLLVRIDALTQVAVEYGSGPTAHVLVAVAKLLNQTIRTEDCLGRMPDDTFALVCRGISIHGARALADRIRKATSQLQVLTAPVATTATIAVVEAKDGPLGTADGLFLEAARLMAEGVALGGDRVMGGDESAP
jgi:diguanylate cyclase (GGDEF)-like protein